MASGDYHESGSIVDGSGPRLFFYNGMGGIAY
jgi:hypothetical protein